MNWRCPRAHLIVVNVFFVFLLLLECMFDARTCDLSVWSVERPT